MARLAPYLVGLSVVGWFVYKLLEVVARIPTVAQ